MRPKIHILASSTRLRPFIPVLRRESTSAIQRIRGFIPLRDVDIVFADNPQHVVRPLATGGWTHTAHLTFIWLDPAHLWFARAIRRELSRTLAHELHHAARWNATGYGQNLGEALVTEGLAAHFEHEVFGGKPNPWDVAFRGAALQHMWRRASREIGSSSYDHNAWFFGSKRRKIPKWTGYALGFSIVGKYLRAHPNQRPSQLVKTPAKDFSTSA